MQPFVFGASFEQGCIAKSCRIADFAIRNVCQRPSPGRARESRKSLIKKRDKTVDTDLQLSYLLRPVIGPEREKDREPFWFSAIRKPGFVVFCRLVRAQKSPASAHVAQLAEHVLGKDEVIGSIPIMGSRLYVID